MTTSSFLPTSVIDSKLAQTKTSFLEILDNSLHNNLFFDYYST